LTPIDVRDADALQRAVAAFVRGPADGLIVLGGPSANAQRDLIAAMVARHPLPAVYAARYFVTAGGLISYGPDVVDQFRRGPGTSIASSRARRRATCRSRRRPSSSGSSIRTAKSLGLDVPPTLLATADEVIE